MYENHMNEYNQTSISDIRIRILAIIYSFIYLEGIKKFFLFDQFEYFYAHFGL